MRFAGKVALVTGAGSGIGKATALILAQDGAAVGVLGHKEAEVQATVAEIAAAGGRAMPLLADVSVPQQMKDAVESLVAAYGRLDIVIANAGINGVWAPIDELEPDEWDHTMAVNLRGTFLTLKYTVPHLRQRGGAVVVTSSGQGTRIFTQEGSHAYACSKAAQVVLVKKVALELASAGIRVNAVCPGSTYTNINDGVVRRNLGRIKLPVEFPAGKVLLKGGKKLEPGEVARVIAFLASDEAAGVTGTEVWVDGGMSLFMG